MALVKVDRVRETSTTTGTGTYTLLGAETGFRTFSSGAGNDNTCPYTTVMGSNWEAGIGTVGPGTLARTEILASSNGNNAVSWSAGTKQIGLGVPAALLPMLQAGNLWEGNQTVTNEDLTGDVAIEVRTDGDYTPRFRWRKQNVSSHTARLWEARVNTGGSWILKDETAGLDRINIDTTGKLNPGVTNSQDLGGFSLRWQDLFLSGLMQIVSDTDAEVSIESTGDGSQPAFKLKKSGVTSDNQREWHMRVNADGQLAIRDHTTGADRLTIGLNGVPIPGADDTYNFGNSTFRWAALYAAIGTIQTSDERLKTDIEDCAIGLELIEHLRPVSYRWSKQEPGSPPHYGILAQQLIEALDGRPFGGIDHDAESDRYGLNYAELVPVLIKAVQELSARVRLLEERTP